MDGWRLKKRRAARTRRSLSPRQAPASTAQLDTGTGRMIDHALHTRRVRRNGEAHEERGVFFFFFFLLRPAFDASHCFFFSSLIATRTSTFWRLAGLSSMVCELLGAWREESPQRGAQQREARSPSLFSTVAGESACVCILTLAGFTYPFVVSLVQSHATPAMDDEFAAFLSEVAQVEAAAATAAGAEEGGQGDGGRGGDPPISPPPPPPRPKLAPPPGPPPPPLGKLPPPPGPPPAIVETVRVYVFMEGAVGLCGVVVSFYLTLQAHGPHP